MQVVNKIDARHIKIKALRMKFKIQKI